MTHPKMDFKLEQRLTLLPMLLTSLEDHRCEASAMEPTRWKPRDIFTRQAQGSSCQPHSEFFHQLIQKLSQPNCRVPLTESLGQGCVQFVRYLVQFLILFQCFPSDPRREVSYYSTVHGCFFLY